MRSDLSATILGCSFSELFPLLIFQLLLARLTSPRLATRFRWLTASMNQGAQQVNFEALMDQVDSELELAGGPFFLGGKLSLVDCMFAPFLERMAASLLYYKVKFLQRLCLVFVITPALRSPQGLPIRRNPRWQNVERWFLAMEGRPSYKHIQSDFYTHAHDLPPQAS